MSRDSFHLFGYGIFLILNLSPVEPNGNSIQLTETQYAELFTEAVNGGIN